MDEKQALRFEVEALRAVPLIRASATQLGVCIEASMDGHNWQTVQLSRYKERSTPTVRQYSTAIDPDRDIHEYFAELDRRGVQYTRLAGDE